MPPLESKSPGILYLPEGSPWHGLISRISLAVGLILAVSILLWLDRDGLRDNIQPDRPLGFADIFYFTVVSLTTVGYGDITPFSTTARLINAVFLTPIRLIVWAIFLGAAVEIVFIRTRESFKMSRLHARLNGHTIICGFGVKGKSILDEMLAHGHKPEDIVVIEPNEPSVQEATTLGVTAIRGDASTEAILKIAAIEKAEHVVAAPHSDDQCVLICLTARHLNPKVRIVASAREEENIKLLYGAGADVVVAPAVSGGRLMGAAVRQRAVTGVLQDLLTFGGGLRACEHIVEPQEVGKTPSEIPSLKNTLLLGICRNQQRVPISEVCDTRLQNGDVVVYVMESPVQEEGVFGEDLGAGRG